MKTQCVLLATIVLTCFLTTTSVRAEETTAEVVARAKGATALLLTRRGSATAFCIDPKGVFVTNHHAVQATGMGNRVNLVLNPSQPNEKKLEAVVLTWLKESDLAILRTTEAHNDLPYLKIGDTESLVETQRLVAFGYPFGGKIAGDENQKPTISVTGGTVTSLRKKDGVLDVLQVDVTLNPGNSGGPVIDREGQVVGIVRAGILGADINFLLPVEKLKKMLEKPLLDFKPEKILDAKKFLPSDFTAYCLWPLPSDERPVECFLELRVKGLETRSVAMKLENGAYHANVSPVQLPSGPKQFSVAVQFPEGSIQGKVTDFSFKIKEKEVWFRNVEQMEPDADEGMCVSLTDDILFGKPEGLDAIEVDLGGAKVNIDAQTIKHMKVSPALKITSVTVCVVAKRDEEELGRVTYDVPFDRLVESRHKQTVLLPFDSDVLKSISEKRDTESSNTSVGVQRGPLKPGNTKKPSVIQMVAPANVKTPLPISLPPQLKNNSTIDLRGVPSQVAVGAGGRFFAVYFFDSRQIAIYDLNKGGYAFSLHIKDRNVLMAASKSKLIVLGIDSGMVQRWDLHSGKMEQEAPIPFPTDVISIAMGSSTNGPLLALCAGDQSPAKKSFALEVMDLETLRSKRLSWDGSKHKSLSSTSVLRASEDGTTFGLWNPEAKPTGVGVISLENNIVRDYYRGEMTSHVSPTFDGQSICTSVGMFPKNLQGFPKRVAESRLTFPAHGSGYLLGGSYKQDPNNRSNPPTLDIHVCLSDKPETTLETISDLSVVRQSRPDARHVPDYDRVHFLSSAGALVLFPINRNHILIRKLDLSSNLIAYPEDHLIVAPISSVEVKAGDLLTVPIIAKSKPRGVGYRLLKAPEGMTISSTGMVSWTPPASASGSSQIVIVQVVNSVQMKRIQSFVIEVR